MSVAADRVCLFELQLTEPKGPFQYGAAVNVRLPGLSEDRRFIPNVTLPVEELTRLRRLGEGDAYRKKLSEAVFGGPDGQLKEAFYKARDIAQYAKTPLRVRIIIDPKVPELHAITWELLGDGMSGFTEAAAPVPIATNQMRLLSRYLNPPLKTLRRSAGRLTCVALVANPRVRNGRSIEIDAIDVDRQLGVIRNHVEQDADITSLTAAQASRQSLLDVMAKGTDILYVVCHGQMKDDKPVLLLESANQELDEVDGTILAETIAGLEVSPPQLVVFGSCESAGGGALCENLDEGFLSSIGASMIKAGVPAVIGMQGSIGQTNNESFCTALFRELFKNGQVELATVIARQEIRTSPQWWMPALLLSKDDGQLWPPRDAREDFPDWDVLLDAIENDKCTPILGSEVVPAFSNREFTRVLLKEIRDEVGSTSSDELSWVAQRYKVLRPVGPGARFDAFIRARIGQDNIRRTGSERLLETVSRWGDSPQAANQVKVLDDLARLPFLVYVDTNPYELLERSLLRHNRTASSEVCPWQGGMQDVQSIDPQSIVQIARETPLVYHLFGALESGSQRESSVVLSEDDFFKHLLWVASNNNLIPIKTPLCNSALLFLGFDLKDWEFRILLRCIATLPGIKLLSGRPHVAVQIPMEEDPDQREKTQHFLKEFFGKSGYDINMSIYYGSVQTFADELLRRWNERHP